MSLICLNWPKLDPKINVQLKSFVCTSIIKLSIYINEDPKIIMELLFSSDGSQKYFGTPLYVQITKKGFIFKRSFYPNLFR